MQDKKSRFSDKLSVVPPIGIDSIRSTIRVGFVPFVTEEIANIFDIFFLVLVFPPQMPENYILYILYII